MFFDELNCPFSDPYRVHAVFPSDVRRDIRLPVQEREWAHCVYTTFVFTNGTKSFRHPILLLFNGLC